MGQFLFLNKGTGIQNTPEDVTALLVAWSGGNEAALAPLIARMHRELHRIATRCMRGERAHHSLQATALVNEAYVRLIDARGVTWQDRCHFLAIAARLMRRVLVDHARARGYQKRGGDAVRVTLVDGLEGSDERSHISSRSMTPCTPWPTLTNARVGLWSCVSSLA